MPGALLDGVVVGLVLMAVFTTAWSANTLSTWPGVVGSALTAAGVAASAWFVVTAVRLARTRGRVSASVTPDEQRWQQRSGRAFGLHFYPMARIFRRRIDTWLATALSAVGVAGLAALLLTEADRDTVWGLVACGAALTTASYGAYFSRTAHELLGRARA